MTERSRVVQMPLGRDRKKSQSQSESSHTSANRYHKPSLASLDPDTFVPSFDILRELADDKDKYIGEESLTIYDFPDSLRTSLDRARARVISPNKPGFSPAVCCCISYGVSMLFPHEDVAVLLNLKDRFDLTECQDAWLVEEIAAVFRYFALALPDTSGSKSHRQNVLLTKSVKHDVSRLTDGLGASVSTVAVLATMITLIEQPCILEQRRKTMQDAVDIFLKKTQIRRIVVESLMEKLKV